MPIRLPRLSLLALSIVATDAFAQTTAASPSPDYSNPLVWLCRPGHPGACDADLTTTVLGPDGRTTVERAPLDPKAPVDCFYVYPTVSTDTTTFSDLVPDAAERNVVRLQFARFGTKCRLFAPMYRQLTLAAMGRANAAGIESPDFLGLGYEDVRAAWRYYLAHDNGNRGVVLIGHSQGTSILTELIRREIDGTPVQSRVVSALLIGGPDGILVRRERDAGGTFAHMPLCRAATETGCVVAYSSFRATAPPSANTRFGRSSDSTLVAACTNPAALGGGEAALNGYFDAAGETALPLGPADPWKVAGRPIATPMVRVVGLLKAQCRSNAFASYLEVSVHRGPGSPASRDIQGDLVEPLGLHLVDMEVAMGNLIELVGQQSRAILAALADTDEDTQQLLLDIMPGLLRFTGAVKRDPKIAAWLAAQPGELQALAKPWLGRMRRCGPDVLELMHDGLATACVRDVPFAYVGIFTAHVNVGFFHGASLPDPGGLLEGSGKRMRHVKLRPGVAVDDSALESLITAAYTDAGMRSMFAD